MALQQAVSEQFSHKGIAGENTRRVSAKYVGAWANGDTMAVQLPNYEAEALGVKSLSCWTDGAGSAGTRLHTYKTEAQVTLTSFNEATGIVTLTNASGGAITNPFFSLEVVGL